MNRQDPTLASHESPFFSSPVAKALGGLAALAMAMGIGRFAFTPLMPMMIDDAGLSIFAAGWLASANYLGYLLGALSALAVRIPPERAIRAGLVAIVITTIGMGLSMSFPVWLVLRLLAGVASAWVLISVSAWSLAVVAAYQRPFLGSVVFAGVGCGIAAAGLLCLVLIGMRIGSAGAWNCLGLLAAIVTTAVWKIFTARDSRMDPPATSTAHAFHWNAEAVKLVCCYGIFGFGYIIPATFLPVMAKNALEGSAAYGLSWPLFGIAAALSTLSASVLLRHMSNRRVWILGHAIMAASIVLPVLWPHLLAIFAAALGVGGTFMVITLVALREAKRIAGQDATVLIAAMTSAFAIGQIVGPLTLKAASGGNATFSAGLLIAALLLALSTLLLRRPESD